MVQKLILWAILIFLASSMIFFPLNYFRGQNGFFKFYTKKNQFSLVGVVQKKLSSEFARNPEKEVFECFASMGILAKM